MISDTLPGVTGHYREFLPSAAMRQKFHYRAITSMISDTYMKKSYPKNLITGQNVMISDILPAFPGRFLTNRPFLGPFFGENAMISWTLPAGNGAREKPVTPGSPVTVLVTEVVSVRNCYKNPFPGRFGKNRCKLLKLFNFTNYQEVPPIGGDRPGKVYPLPFGGEGDFFGKGEEGE